MNDLMFETHLDHTLLWCIQAKMQIMVIKQIWDELYTDTLLFYNLFIAKFRSTLMSSKLHITIEQWRS